jgi:nitrite reductase/ring-hydroxylating ferredoxin subunit
MSIAGNPWTAVAQLDALDDPGTRGFTFEGWDHWGFVVRDGEHVAAFVNVCPHAGHPLHWKPHGFLTPDGEQLICASHGALFDRRSGECLGGPCAPGSRLQRLPVRIRGTTVEVQLPAAAR